MSYQQYQQYGGNPHAGYGEEAGYNAGNPYGTQVSEPAQSELRPPPALAHETSNYSQSQTSNYSTPQPTILSQGDFLARVEAIRGRITTLTSNVSNISTLHQRALAEAGSGSSSSLESLVSQTQILNTKIKDEIRSLEVDAKKTPQGQGGSGGLRKVKLDQHAALKRSFDKELQGYQEEERTYQRRYRDQIARQYRIVNPDADAAEVEEATNADWGNEGVFQTALKSNRTGAVRSTLDTVRARHTDIVRIEKTLMDLELLFRQLGEVVEVQEPAVAGAELNAEGTVGHMEEGIKHQDKAVASARRARKLKWWTFGIVVLIIVILAAVLGGYFGSGANKKNPPPAPAPSPTPSPA
ncbi:MAG: hypothetical protein M4579_005311 [Chaenotheca gracillima]|nr:MAG: hypothetical protein M4579_005311 [Chaenotheca gracillima]